MITAGSYDLLAEVVAESDEHLLEIISDQIRGDRRRARRPRRSCTSSCASRPTRGECADAQQSYGRSLALARDDADRLDAAAAARRRRRGRRGDRRRRLHRALDGLLPRRGRPVAADRGGRGGGRRLRRLGAQRRLVLGAVPGLAAALARMAARTPRASRRDARSVDEVLRVAAAEGIDCHVAKGGTIVLARGSTAQLSAGARRSTATQVLSAARGRAERLRATRTLGATYTPDCAAIHPARLVRGLADAVDRRGVAHPRADAGARRSRRAWCARRAASVRAPYVVRATEGFTPRLPGLAPSGGAGLLADHRHRAAARRDLGRDRAGAARDVLRPPAPDHLRAAHRRRPARLRRPRRAVPPGLADPPGVRPRAAGLRRRCTRRCSTCSRCCAAPGSPTPGAGRSGSRATGAPRSGWTAATGLAWAGGYVGDGVSTTNLAGRTLARPGPRPGHRADPRCPGSATARRRGSPSRCAGSASTPGCAR